MKSSLPSELRWHSYVREPQSELVQQWTERSQQKHMRVLYVLGLGFDPRMCLGLECMVNTVGLADVDVWVLEFDEGPTSPSQTLRPLVDANAARLSEIGIPAGRIVTKSVRMTSSDGRRRTGPRSAAQVFTEPKSVEGYTDIVVDISALPRALYFAVVAALIHTIDGMSSKINLHVFVADDADLDEYIQDQRPLDQAEYVFPFGGDDRESQVHLPTIWIPLLGEGQELQLRAIDEWLDSSNTNKEIVPILPFPSRNPRRADKIFLEYRTLLLEGLRVEPANFAYADEQNPFAVYRQIMRFVRRYRESFEPLGGVRFTLSAMSSKLFSIGSLLAAYEMRESQIPVVVAHVECQGYSLHETAEFNGELFGLWLTGEPYEC